MALLTAQTVSIAGTAPTYGAVAASDTLAVVGTMFLHVKNTSGTADTVTLVDNSRTAAGSAATNPTVTVPITTGDRMIGPIPAAMADPSTGLVTVTHSQTTSVTCALMRL